jgi:tRNA nucleotidyltransferase (CCA-adding enzyme)
MLTAGAIMTPTLFTVRPDASIEEAIELLLREGISGLPVLDADGRLVGVITEFALLAIAYDRRVKNHTVSQHMTRDLITVDVDDPVSRVADLCIVHRVRRVPVIKEGRMVGVIARRDVLRALVENALEACSA